MIASSIPKMPTLWRSKNNKKYQWDIRIAPVYVVVWIVSTTDTMALTSVLLIILKIFRFFGGFPYKIANGQFKKSRTWKLWSLSLCSVSVLATFIYSATIIIKLLIDPRSEFPHYYLAVSITSFYSCCLYMWISMIFKKKHLLKIIKYLLKAPSACYGYQPKKLWHKFVFVVFFTNILEELYFEETFVIQIFLIFYAALIINMNLYLIFLLMENATQQFNLLEDALKSKNDVLRFHKLVKSINFYGKWQLLLVLLSYSIFILRTIAFGSYSSRYASGAYFISSIATIAVILVIADYPHDKVLVKTKRVKNVQFCINVFFIFK